LLSSTESSTVILDVPVLHPTDAAVSDFDERCPWDYQGVFIIIIILSPKSEQYTQILRNWTTLHQLHREASSIPRNCWPARDTFATCLASAPSQNAPRASSRTFPRPPIGTRCRSPSSPSPTLTLTLMKKNHSFRWRALGKCDSWSLRPRPHPRQSPSGKSPRGVTSCERSSRRSDFGPAG
jgi:hypothetical protein